MFARILLVLAVGLLPGMALADDSPAAPDSAAPDADRLAELVNQLDADDFSTRDAATRELQRIGEPALPVLRRLLEGEIGAEQRRRAEGLVRGIELTLLEKNAIHVERVLDLSVAPEGESADERTARHEKLDTLLANIVKIVNNATGREFPAPKRFADLPEVAAATSVSNGIVVVGTGQRVSRTKDAIVLLDTGGDVSFVEGCVVLARFGARLSFCKQSLVLARYELNVSHPENSILFCGRRMNLSIVKNCVCGAGGDLRLSIPKETVVLNTKFDLNRGRGGAELRTTPGLVLRLTAKNPLAERISVTAALPTNGGIALYMRGDRGEFVARPGRPLADPDGKPFDDLDGWRLEYVSAAIAVFVKGNEHAVFEVAK